MNIINKYVDKILNSMTDSIETSLASSNDVSYSNKLNTFRNKLEEGQGPSFASKFIFELEIPNLLKKQDSFMALLGFTEFDDTMAILGSDVSLGERKLKTVSVPYYNGLNRTIPLGYDYSNITISYIERSDRMVTKLFQDWLNKITDPINGCGHFFNDICSDGRLLFYDRNDKTKTYLNFQEMTPVSVKMTEPSWSSDNIVKVDVEFSYTIQSNESFYILSKLNSIASVGASDLIQTLW